MSVEQVENNAWAGLETAMSALGRAALLVDENFVVIRATSGINTMVCDDASTRIVDRPVDAIFGEELLGPDSPSRVSLLRGDRVEGRRAFLHCREMGARLVSLSMAVLPEHELGAGGRFLLVLRPAEDVRQDVNTALSDLGLASRSAQMFELVRVIEALHLSQATVLITGESGTGKEVLARAIHMRSPRHAGPFIGVNCAALPGGLLESELFGHIKGAFTGAETDRVGRLELASEGTLFLDEIGDVPPELQVKLLRVLQEREYERVGESTPRAFTARVIAATNVNIDEALASGQLRSDLYYRLRVVPLHLPPLRERMDDLEILSRTLLQRIGGETGRALVVSPDAMRAMRGHSWPGNVRELENALRYATAMCQGQTIGIEHLPSPIGDDVSAVPTAPPDTAIQTCVSPTPAPRSAAAADAAADADLDLEAACIRQALDAHHWRRADAARALGISRTTLWRRMQALGLS